MVKITLKKMVRTEKLFAMKKWCDQYVCIEYHDVPFDADHEQFGTYFDRGLLKQWDEVSIHQLRGVDFQNTFSTRSLLIFAARITPFI